MSYLNTKQALIQQLLATPITGIAADDIAFENKNFNPANRSAFVSCYFIPATADIMGKTSASSDEQRGVFQVSVFVQLDSKEFDNTQLQMVDDVLAGFQYNTQTVYTGQVVQVLSSTANAGTENESWFKRDISINYLTFSKRG